MEELNYLAIFIATIVSYGIGFIWFSKKVFGDKWMSYQRFSSEQIEKAENEGMAKTVIWGFVLEFILVGALSYTTIALDKNAVCAVLLISIGVLLPIMAGNVLWEKKPCMVFFINFFHRAVSLSVAAYILSLFY